MFGVDMNNLTALKRRPWPLRPPGTGKCHTADAWSRALCRTAANNSDLGGRNGMTLRLVALDRCDSGRPVWAILDGGAADVAVTIDLKVT